MLYLTQAAVVLGRGLRLLSPAGYPQHLCRIAS